MLLEQPAIKKPPNRRLDLLTFSVSGLRDGLGPLLGVFLIQKTHFDAFQVACVLAAAGITNLLLQIPVGHFYDIAKKPNLLLGLGGFCLAFSCYLLSQAPSYTVALFSQALVGIGGCLLSVGLPAITVFCTASALVRGRIARNEIFNKLGNFCSIGLMGIISQRFDLHWMFYVIYLAAGAVILNCIKSFAKQETTEFPHVATSSFSSFFSSALSNSAFLSILLLGFIYQFANTSMFMIFEQQFVRQQINGGVGIISATLLVTQVTIIICCLLLSRTTRVIQNTSAMQIGMTLIALRGFILLSNTSVASLFVSQILDGIIAALLIVVPLSAIAKFAGNNFNRMSATFGMVVAAGASLSTITSGYIITHYSFNAAYLVLICMAITGVVLTRFTRDNIAHP